MQQREAARGKSTSIRFSDHDKKTISEKASEKGMGFSEYVRDRASHGESNLSPYAKICIQNLINDAYDTIRDSDPDKAQKYEEEMTKIWTL